MRFWKMQGIGNDFVITDEIIPNPSKAARLLCDRRFGIGADGLILAMSSQTADARMRIFNADGSEAEMCGNGIRCLGRYLIEHSHVDRRELDIETKSGIKHLSIHGQNVTVNMGAPCLIPQQIPVLSPTNEVSLNISGMFAHFFCVSMGNPHAITFDIFPSRETFLRVAPPLEHNPVFPLHTNVTFARITPGGDIEMRVWERGAGETLACGTGACAALVAAVCTGRSKREATVRLPGGELSIRWNTDDCVYMTGSAQVSFIGETSLL